MASGSEERGRSRPSLHRLESRSVDPESTLSFLMVTNENAKYFEYDPEQTYMVSYAIGQQTSPRTSRKSLGPETILSCLQVSLQKSLICK